MISRTQGWLHCDIPGADAQRRQLPDGFYTRRIHQGSDAEPAAHHRPRRQIDCGGQGDISINVKYAKPPRTNHDLVSKVCERPAVVARRPVAAIRPAMVDGKPSLEVDESKCVCCGGCYPPWPPMQINGADSSKIAVWVGGKHSNARWPRTARRNSSARRWKKGTKSTASSSTTMASTMARVTPCRRQTIATYSARSEIALTKIIDLVVCIAAAQRRGILNVNEAKRQGKDGDNIAPGFRISGLGQLIEAGIEAYRLLVFGD